MNTFFKSIVTCAALASASVALAAVEVARVNDKVITDDYLNSRFEEAVRANPAAYTNKKEFLQELIKKEVAVQEARRLGLDKDPAVQDQMNTVLFQALLDKQMAQKIDAIRVTDDEAKSFFERNPEIRTSHIFIGVKPGATKEEEKASFDRIKDIRDKHLKDPKQSFAEVAQRFSESPAAPMGGDIDYQTRDRLDPAYYNAAVKLKTPGKISDIVRTPAGYFIIKLSGIRTWAEADRAKFKRIVFEQKRAKALDGWLNSLVSRAKTSINTKAIR